MTKTKEIVTVEPRSLLLDVELFNHAQRVGKMLATSTMVPEHFRNNIGNCVIALNYANRVGIDPFMAMQKMYIIHGKPAIETQLQIALFNKCGRFTPLKFKLNAGKTTCYAYATEISTKEKIEGVTITIEMSKKEGWYNKKGSKWQTLPELMLRYRAAAFFIRLYAPETTLGLYTAEEMRDVVDITPKTPEKEIEENANTVLLDITPEHEKQQEEAIEETETPEAEQQEMTDAEKKAIIEQEIETAGGEEPGF